MMNRVQHFLRCHQKHPLTIPRHQQQALQIYDNIAIDRSIYGRYLMIPTIQHQQMMKFHQWKSSSNWIFPTRMLPIHRSYHTSTLFNGSLTTTATATNDKQSFILCIHRRPIQFVCKRMFWSEIIQQLPSIWGGSGFLIKVFHGNMGIPYWACFAAMSLLVRTILIPAVVYGARTSARFAKVVPEMQFVLSLYVNDMKHLNKRTDPPVTNRERWQLMKINLQTVNGIYKLHKIKPYAIFLSPILQIPFFWYVSIDMRKIINGLDPMLAQHLVDTTIGWIPDLTEPDPWFGLPIIAGLAMYSHLEIAMGKRTLAGPAASKTDTGIWFKDMFQTFAIFMPCITSQLPAGIQIYVVTSFVYTILQSAALRNDLIRSYIGIPLLSAPPPEAKYAKQFIELKQLEQKARELRGPNGIVYGKHGVLAYGLEASFLGTYRPTTIQGSAKDVPTISIFGTASSSTSKLKLQAAASGILPQEILDMPYVNGVSAPLSQLIEQYQSQHQQKQQEQQSGELFARSLMEQQEDRNEYMPVIDDEIMEKAKRGDRSMMAEMLKLETKTNNSKVRNKSSNDNTRTTSGTSVLNINRFVNPTAGKGKKGSGSKSGKTKKKKR